VSAELDTGSTGRSAVGRRTRDDRPVHEEPVGLGVDAGLCGSCRHAIIRPTRRGPIYLRCARAASDLRFPKYPPLPVRACGGHDLQPEQA